ncbi:Biflaviolin synthase [Nocardia seriolae]|uniref:Biflaviolin synthase n=1 Tax=Nocardia seriolae TaxID=37332 RepID=A0ABC8ARM5_9NOCA|nr:cytochrome P450 [Nocardia seriolae]APA96739.1 Biflaviolin synthase [Nocardia seriolae]
METRTATHPRVERGVSPAGDPAWIVRDYATIKKLLTDSRINRFPDPAVADPPRFTLAEILQFKQVDPDAPPPPDDLVRRMVATSFSPRRMRAIEPAVNAITRELIEDMRRDGPPADIRTALAEPLSSHVISELLGIPAEARAAVREWSDASVDLADRERSVRADRELKAFMNELVEAKTRQPGEDILSDMVRFSANEPQLAGRDLVIGMAAGLRFAGQINTVTLIDRGLFLLLTRPIERATLADSKTLERVVEEILRFPHPVQRRIAGVPRYARADIPLGGHVIGEGDLVILELDDANLDPGVFADAESFCPERTENPHLSFGYGPHYCVGAALARMELKSVFGNIFQLLPDLRIDGDPGALEPRRHQLSGGVMALPVTWTRG